jgi:hypothetical protein
MGAFISTLDVVVVVATALPVMQARLGALAAAGVVAAVLAPGKMTLAGPAE